MLGQEAIKKLGKVRPPNIGGWRDAIQDAERQIAETKARLARLKAALAFCRERLESGEPWPGTVAAGGPKTEKPRRLHQASE